MSSSECLSDKSGDTESEPEFVTATGSANDNQTSSEESNLDEKVEEEHDVVAQDDETTSDSGRDEYEEEMRKKSSVKKRKCKKKKRTKKKEKTDHFANTSESSSDSEKQNNTDEEDYSDEEHVLLVTSIANLRRRESMKLKPLRVRSKEAPIIKEKVRKEEKNPTLLNMDKTKEMIQQQMQKDERKIQDRNPKRQLISEEKWSEGTNWNDLVQEGAERELVYLAEEEMKVKEREPETDKALRIMVPGTKVINL